MPTEIDRYLENKRRSSEDNRVGRAFDLVDEPDTRSDYVVRKKLERETKSHAAALRLREAPDPDEYAKNVEVSETYTAEVNPKVTPPPSFVGKNRDRLTKDIELRRTTTALNSSPMLLRWLENSQKAPLAADDVGVLADIEAGLVNVRNALKRGVVDRGGQVGSQIVSDLFLYSSEQHSSTFAERYRAARGRNYGHGVFGNPEIREAITGPDGRVVENASEIIQSFGDDSVGAFLSAATGTVVQIFNEYAGATPDSDVRIAIGFQQRAAEFAQSAAETPVGETARRALDRLSNNGEPLTLSEAASITFDLAANDPAALLAMIGEVGVESAGALIPAAVATAVTRNPAVGAGTLAGTTYSVERATAPVEFFAERGFDLTKEDDVRRMLENSDLMQEAADKGHVRGLIIGALDLVSGGIAGRALAANPVADAALQSLTQGLFGGAGEGLAQQATEGQVNFGDVVVEALAEFATAPLDVAAVGARALGERKTKARQAVQDNELLRGLSENARNSKLRARDPAAFRSYVEQSLQGTESENLYVSADAFVEYFQSQGVDLKEVAEVLPGVNLEQLERAAVTGEDVLIPTATYLERVAGSDLDAFMMENAKLAPDQLSPAEAREFEESEDLATARVVAQQEAAQVERLTENDVETRLSQDIEQQLVEAGRPRAAAQQEAQLYPAFYRTLARRMGITTEELVRRYAPPTVDSLTTQEASRFAAGRQYNQIETVDLYQSGVAQQDKPREFRVVTRTVYPEAGGTVGGLEVTETVDNMASISATLEDYEILSGIREIPLTDFGAYEPVRDKRRLALAEQIKQNGKIMPLIIVIDREGPYILEGSHRIDALTVLGKDTIPAVVVVDTDEDVGLDIWDDVVETGGRDENPNQIELFRNDTSYHQSAIDQTQTEEFKAWAGNSVITQDGELPSQGGIPKVFYHGTGREGIEIFNAEHGAFFADEDTALLYQRRGVPLIPAYIKTDRTYYVDGEGRDYNDLAEVATDIVEEAVEELGYEETLELVDLKRIETDDVVKLADKLGYDAVVFNDIKDAPLGKQAQAKNTQVIAVLNPKNIKSATGNVGTFDPNDANIYRQNVPSLTPAVRVGRKVYKADSGGDHLNALGKIEDAGERRSASTDSSNRGFVDEKGKFLDRYKAQEFAVAYGLIAEDAPEWAKTSPELIAENLNQFYQQERGRIRVPKGGAQSGQSVIELFQSADLSTFLHESGHFFLTVLQDAATQDSAPRASLPDSLRISDILRSEDGAATAARGGSKTSGPVKVTQLPDGRVYLINGYHRVQDAIDAGRDDIDVEFVPYDKVAILYENEKSFVTDTKPLKLEQQNTVQQMYEQTKRWFASNADELAKEAGVGREDVLRYLSGERSDVAKTNDSIDRTMQEQWARAFETYLLEGKAPTPTLRAAFEQFRAWLLQVYKQVRGDLRVNVTDDIREVFDMLLATDEEIKIAEADNAGAPIATSATELGVSEDEFAKLQDLYRDARDQTAAKMLDSAMEPVRKMRDKKFRERKKEIEIEVAAEVNARPVYRAVEWMGNRRWLGEGDEPTIPAGMRLDKDQLVERYGKRALRKLPRGVFRVYTVDGMDADEAAGWFGFSSGDEMIQAMQAEPRREEVIKTETERRLQEEIAADTSVTDASVQATRAYHEADKRGDYIAAELRALNQSIGDLRQARVLTAKYAREIARRTINRMKTRDATAVSRYLAAERREASAAQEAFKVGDRRRAAGHKYKQLFNHMMVSEANKVINEVGKLERLAKRLNGPNTRKRLSKDYLGAIYDVLEQYDFRKLTSGKERSRERMLAYVAQMQEQGRENEIAIPQHILDNAKAEPYMTLPVERLRGVYDTLRNIENTARRHKKVIDAQRERDMDQIVNDMADAFDQNIRTAPPSRVDNPKERRRRTGRQYLNLLLNADTLLREIDGFKDDGEGAAYQNIKSGIDRANARLQVRRKEAAEKFEDLYSVYETKERNIMAVQEFIPELGTSMAKWDLISIVLNMGNEDNIQRLTDKKVRGNFTQVQLDAVLKRMDKRDMDFVQSVWDYVDSFYAEIAERERRVTGIAPQKVAAQELHTPHGTYKGGYYPLKYDPRGSDRVTNEDYENVMDNMRAGRFGKAQTRNGHTKERAKSSGMPVLLDIGVLHSHVNTVLHDLEMSEEVTNAWRILQEPRVKDLFTEAGRLEDHRALEMWVQDTASGQVNAGDIVARTARFLKSGFTVSKLAFNLSTVAIQITGVAQSMVVIGKKNFTKGVIRYAMSGWDGQNWRPEAASEVLNKSPFMAERETTFNKDIYDIMGDIKVGPKAGVYQRVVQNYLGPMAFYAMQKVQFYAVDLPTWLGAYEKALVDTEQDEAASIAAADRAVARSQASGIFSDRTPIERGTLSPTVRQSDFVRMFTALGSYMFAKANVAYERTGKTDFTDPSEVFSYVVDMVLLFTIEAVLYNAVKGSLPGMGDDDDEDENWAQFLAKETALSVMSTLPFVRDLASPFQGFSGGGSYGSITESLVKPFVQASQGELDKPLFKSTVDAGGMLLHLPSTQLNRILDAEWRRRDGEDVSPIEYIMGKR